MLVNWWRNRNCFPPSTHKDMNRFPFTCHLRISNRHLFLLRPHSRREEHWQYYSTTPTGLGFSGLHQKTPEQLPRQVSPGSVFCIAPQFAFLPQIFRATGSAAQNQRALHGSVIRAPPFPKQYAQRESPWIFFSPHFLFSLNNVAEPPRAGKLRTFWVTDISVAHLRRQTRVFWARRKG